MICQKKTSEVNELPPRLLEREEIEILDPKCKPIQHSVTRYDIERDVNDLLKRGITTTFAGGFFFIPYLLQLDAHTLFQSLVPPKKAGIPNDRVALGLVFESLFGLKEGIRSINPISQKDFGLLAGLPFLPSPSTQYRFLQAIPYNSSLTFQVALAKKLVQLGHVVPGSPINIDGHNIKTYSRKAMKKSYITQEGRYGKAIRTFYTQDQLSKKPLITMAAYSGTAVSQITRCITDLTRDVLDRSFLLVADKEWYCGQLIQELHQENGVSILTPVKQSKKRLVEFEAVPLDQYDTTIFGNIATLYTTIKNCDQPLRLFLKKGLDGKYFGLISPDLSLTGSVAMPTYTKRWRIEDFFLENEFLGVNRLPSLNLNLIQAMLSLRLLAYHVLDNFRHDLGPDFRNKTPKTIYRDFINGVQGRIQLRGNTIEVRIYGFQHDAVVSSLMSDLDDQLKCADVEPRIPWLRNRTIQFKFS